MFVEIDVNGIQKVFLKRAKLFCFEFKLCCKNDLLAVEALECCKGDSKTYSGDSKETGNFALKINLN